MEIAYHGSPAPTLGVELELGIVDRSSRRPEPAASELLAEVGTGHPAGEHPKVKHELFESTVEIITGVCATVAEARADLSATFREVAAAADGRGLGLLGSGTHPFATWGELTLSPVPRYAALVEALQWPARRLAIHGVHFHVGVPSGPFAIGVLDALRPRLPLFLALSASSPYWEGIDTGLASCRTKVFEGLPTAGLPPTLASWEDFESFMATLMRAGVIASVREVWWDIRPHPDFGTVELRMCDGLTSFDDVAALAALAQCCVADATERLAAGNPAPVQREWVHRENKWLAARFGLDTALIVDDQGSRRPIAEVIVDLLAELAPTAERLGCATELAGVQALVERGPSYRRQRALVDAGASLVEVVDAGIAELEASA